MKERSWRLLVELFVTFLKIGPVTFGGGYAMIPVIEREVVGKREWIAEKDMSDVLSVAGSAPGGIGVNAAAFVGYRMAGLAGAASAVLGITLPTFLLALALCLVYAGVGDYPKVEAALQGIHAAVFGLIIVAAYRMGRQAVVDKTTFASAVCTLVLLLSAPIHPLFVIASGLWLGIVFVMVKQKLGIVVQLNGPETGDSDTRYGGHKYADYYIADGI
ncbi:chromate transporter [Paenibacillus sp. UNCCL117]|uniref:chromate transporter n=1 Tax=unclassified Paenibacillus TaxID=185978 RepID=UPI00088104ED|nr:MULTISPECIES: chromate transporter [unclassified Paenibacillus]SDE14487.1 chromate transporter [Paenibacillus sp. cl123]SFW60614.1 chromate transporter [Paenibacillus sp. UNCCL117]